MSEEDILQALERQVTDLAFRYDDLKGHYLRLKADYARLREERERLLEHNRLAREKIESMITRLKALETNHDG
jgi:cell division protein ZapB